MPHTQRSFIPAAGHDWLLPLYDPLTRLVGADSLRGDLVRNAGILGGWRILDIGCGTGSLAIHIKKLHPEADMTGLDPDPKALARARRKATRAAVDASFDQGFSDNLPYPDDGFDLVFSSFMLHHLKPQEQSATLSEVRRVLRPGASFHVVDFGGAHGFLDIEHSLPAKLRDAGFDAVEQTAKRRTILGSALHCTGRA